MFPLGQVMSIRYRLDMTGWATRQELDAQDAAQSQALAEAELGNLKLSEDTPLAENATPDAGASTKAAHADHVHPRLTSATLATLGANGQVSVTFTRTFAAKPVPALLEVEANPVHQPLALRVLSYSQNGQGLYAGATIQGLRARVLPVLYPLHGVLSAVTHGLNGAFELLSEYDMFAGAAAGAKVSCVFIEASN